MPTKYRTLSEIAHFFNDHDTTTLKELRKFGVSDYMIKDMRYGFNKADAVLKHLDGDTFGFSADAFEKRYNSRVQYPEGLWMRDQKRFIPGAGVSAEQASAFITCKVAEAAERQNLVINNFRYSADQHFYENATAYIG